MVDEYQLYICPTVMGKGRIDDNAVVTWEAKFTADGASKEEAEKGVRDFFQLGMDSLKEIFQ